MCVVDGDGSGSSVQESIRFGEIVQNAALLPVRALRFHADQQSSQSFVFFHFIGKTQRVTKSLNQHF